MSGKCFSCASQFGLFKKEHGCPSCGFAFCKDCLKKKIAVPRKNHEEHKVCNKCFKVLSGAVCDSPAKFSPPEALKKRLAALETKEMKDGKSSSRRQTHQAPVQSYKGMSNEDIALQKRLDNLRKERQKDLPATPSEKEIESRLKNLKDERTSVPSDEEMARRLAVLKGQDPGTINQPPIVFKPTVRKNEQQQIDELLGEICDEVMIDSQAGNSDLLVTMCLAADLKADATLPTGVKPTTSSGENMDVNEMNRLMNEVAAEMHIDARKAIKGLKDDKELMERLDQLKKERKNKGEKDTTDRISDSSEEDSEDEEKTMKRIIKQAVEECKLDEELEELSPDVLSASSSHKKSGRANSKPSTLPADNHASDDPEELPWCCICNEDATVRCVGCDYDLYCKRCFKEGHDQFDMADHRTVPFKQRRK